VPGTGGSGVVTVPGELGMMNAPVAAGVRSPAACPAATKRLAERVQMATDVNFDVSEIDRNGTPVLEVRGEVDVSTAPELREKLLALAEQGRTVAVVDLSDVSFVDSTALGVLVSGVKRLRSAGGDLRLVVTQPRISKVFEITGLTDVFRIYPSAEEAVRG
jgi:anti-sigma B factor antagonist